MILFKEYPDILSIAQVAQALGIGRKAVYALVHAKQLGHKKIGKRYLVPKFCVEEYVKSARNNVVL